MSPEKINSMYELTLLLATFTDPRKSPSADEELDLFARIIDDAKAIHGDLYEGDAA